LLWQVRLEFATCRVLIADDKEPNLRAQKALLREMGFTNVAAATQGREALEMADEIWPDLVLLDIVMPVMDGIECAQKLRERPKGPALVVIGTTASFSGVIEVEAYFDDVLLKPIDPERLQQAIERSSRITFGERSVLERRVLVVDDQPLVRRIIQLELSKGGYQVSLCGSGAEALRRLETDQFDLILMDRLMPAMDGVETAGKILGTISKPPPIVLMSADVPKEIAQEMPPGVIATLEKPFTIAQFDLIFREVAAKA